VVAGIFVQLIFAGSAAMAGTMATANRLANQTLFMARLLDRV
jgi:hypothetical protein